MCFQVFFLLKLIAPLPKVLEAAKKNVFFF